MPDFTSMYYHSPIGVLRISSDGQCISEVRFLKDDEPPLAAPPAGPSLPLLQACMEQLMEYFNGHRRRFDIPVRQEGTAFQQQVWNELLTIPFGKTISYLTLSKKIEHTKAIRAAAAANGKNNIAILVPCHRVIGSNQDLVGYAGGLWRKKWLLAMENKIAWGVQTLF